MQGLLNRSIEFFLRTTYGDHVWTEIATRAGIDPQGFLGLRSYPGDPTTRMLRAASARLEKSPSELLEDTGGCVVRCESLRRLLRFSGSSFSDFVLALEELPGRARMILPHLTFPTINVIQREADHYRIEGENWSRGLEWLLAGALRGIADDYGVLALIDVRRSGVELRVMLQAFTPGNPFTFAPFSVAGGAR